MEARTIFKFDLNNEVLISVSGEKGLVTARAEYLRDEPQYRVQYKAADGRATEAWWQESALEAA